MRFFFLDFFLRKFVMLYPVLKVFFRSMSSLPEFIVMFQERLKPFANRDTFRVAFFLFV